MEEEQHENEGNISSDEEIDEEEDDGGSNDEYDDLHSRGDSAREAAMRRRGGRGPMRACDHINVGVKDDNAAMATAQTWASDKYNLRLATNSWLGNIALSFSPKVTTRGANLLIDGFRQLVHVEKLTMELKRHNVGGAVIPSALHFLGETLRMLPELQINTELNDVIADRLGAKLRNNKSIKKMKIRLGRDLTNDGARRFASGLASCKLMEHLELNFDKSRGDNGSKALQHIFTTGIKNIHTMNLTSSLNSRSAVVLGNGLEGNQALRTLRLDFHDHNFTAAGARGLAEGLRLSNITRLILCGEAVGETSQTIMYEQGICGSESIRHLIIPPLFTKGATALAKCLSVLKILEIDDDYRKRPSLTNFLSVNFGNASGLSVLTLGPFLSAADVIRLSEVLPDLTALTRLHITCNLTCEEGAVWTDEVENLPNRPRLADRRYLIADHQANPVARPLYSDLESRNIRAIGAEALMTAVANHPSLVELDLSHSLDVGFMGLEMIGLHLPNVKLKKLYLYTLDDKFHLKGNENDMNRALTRSSQALVAGVQASFFLQSLYVKYLGLPAPAWKEIKFYLDLNKSGRCLLHGEHHGVATGGWSLILAKCRNKASVMYYLLREQPQLLLLAATVEAESPDARQTKRRRQI